MGFFSNLFSKHESTEAVESVSEIPYTPDMLRAAVNAMMRATTKPVVHMELSKEPVGLTDSKFGGIPYLPKDSSAPLSRAGEQLRLLAQINTKDLPSNELELPQGILQFWVLDDDLSGLELSQHDLTAQNNFRVLFYDAVDPAVTEEDVLQKYKPSCEEDGCFPISDTFGLTFSAGHEGISTADFKFDRLFVRYWNYTNPGFPIQDAGDLPSELIEKVYDAYLGDGHKLGGYPMFTQCDPREGDMEQYEHLLLQIDSDHLGDKEIMWGDCGVANFFITEEAFRRRDFTKVLYTWDCC